MRYLFLCLLLGCAAPENFDSLVDHWIEPASENPLSTKLSSIFGEGDCYRFGSDQVLDVSSDTLWVSVPWERQDDNVVTAPGVGELTFYQQDTEWHVRIDRGAIEAETAIKECHKYAEDSGDYP